MTEAQQHLFDRMRVRPHGSFCLRIEKGPPGGVSRRGVTMETWPGRGPNQPAEDDQAPDVRPCRLPSPTRPGAAVYTRDILRSGSMTQFPFELGRERDRFRAIAGSP